VDHDDRETNDSYAEGNIGPMEVPPPPPESARPSVHIGRPSKSEPYRGLVSEMLTQEPDLPSSELLRRAKLAGYAGGKSALYDLVARVRAGLAGPSSRRVIAPGARTQHAFGVVQVGVGTARRRVHFLASRLPYSGKVEASITEDEDVETLLRTLVAHFQSLGGVPLLASFETPWPELQLDDAMGWDAAFGKAMVELGVGLEFGASHVGGLASLGAWVKRAFFHHNRTFSDDADLRSQLAGFVAGSNGSDAAPVERVAEEQLRLRPVALTPERLGVRVPVAVRPPGSVAHGSHLYPVPGSLIGALGALLLFPDRVEIAVEGYRATHPRTPRN
jgi:hypothetical protein